MRVSREKVHQFMQEQSIQTQTELAKRMGITKNQLSVMLSSRFDPIKSNIVTLAHCLSVSVVEILEKGSDEEAQERDTSLHFDPYSLPDFTPNGFTNIELFAGAGGLALGIEKAGFEAAGLVEIDADACATLRMNRPKWVVIQEDIIKVADNGIRNYLLKPNIEIDFLSGGYPCQAFSYAGMRRGLEDARGTLFYYYAKILEDIRPKIFLAENVRGLVSHENGRTLETMLSVFNDIGYNVQCKLLNAKNYGVAQKRERIVIIGTRIDLPNIYCFPKECDYKPTLKDALIDVPKSIGEKYPPRKEAIMRLIPPGGCWRDLPEDLAKEYMMKSYYLGGGRTGMARRISWDEPCLTLTCSPSQKQTERCHPDETRPFTTREYARIQSFPDSWGFSGTMGSIYRQIGNAVPVELAYHISCSIRDYLDIIKREND